MNQGPAAARYTELATRREYFLMRGRDAAELTIPSLLPPEGFTGSSRLPEPYCGLSARCVQNLSSKLTIALLPPGSSVFRLSVPAEVLAQADQPAVSADMESKLSLVEKKHHSEIARRNWRSSVLLALQHLIVTGNALVRMMPNNSLRVFRLDQYVLVRSPDGEVLEIVIREALVPAALPARLRDMVQAEDTTKGVVHLYTHLRRDDAEWEVYQEIGDRRVPGSAGTFRLDKCPYVALRWNHVLGEDYGRSKVEDHIADHRYAEVLTKSLGDGAIMASRNVTMTRPNAAGGLNLRRRIAQANNGDVIAGNPEDVAMLEFKNVGGMQFTAAELQNVKQELREAYLLTSAARRDAERVTAYELRQMVEELEGALGGVYSILGADMMQPLIGRLIFQMAAAGSTPELPEELVSPTVLTGVEALAREADVQKSQVALEFVKNSPPEIMDYVKVPEIVKPALTGLGFANAVRTEDEAQAIRQQRAALEAMTAAAPGLMEQEAAGVAPAPPQ